ncbi:succinylglutamate desuccinylase/aspartoacylase family protein [Burkholderia sp. AU36459]|uniref:succinylglutamate desuccinylase/aspartoacylase family protein n=1 Tax=Burkholderia sp. AU36459 TaxID=2879632 RepID=UPI001CF4B4F6|nr:succinylglutamate desuccinylase/aspartoacylase family protein [Burkholderia sp. AU36459]MCA8104121.1 M14 family metallopeptidase [Burkholderia sp. AU36459]
MQIRTTPLLSPSIGTQRTLTSFHFGPADCGRKIYLQAALHADETPAMLAAVMLKQRLAQLDAEGRLAAEIVLVPVANPVGLNHHLLGQFIGRFDLASGRNFNRGFLPLAEIAARARDRLGDDGVRNRAIVRECVGAALDEIAPRTEFDALQLALLKLSHDADVVIDLHCSLEAVMHVYTSDTAWPDVEPLARYLGVEVSLLAEDSGGHAFDDAHHLLWSRLRTHLPSGTPMASGTVAVTVECRGQRDVTYDYARRDAGALVDYLVWCGAVRGERAPLPPLAAPATPLAGSEQFYAPVSGILVHRAPIGAMIRAGDPLFDIVDPLTDAVTTISSATDGVFYMRRAIRFVTAGAPLGRVTGTVPVRKGVLLGA